MQNQKFKVLVVDQNKEALENTKSVFVNDGFDVITSTTSEDAIKKAKEELPHIIILELVMPKLDGIDICIELRRDSDLSNTLILFYTERDDDYSQIAAFNAGADDYVIKPQKGRVLLSRSKALLRRHHRLNETSDVNYLRGLTIDRERYLIFKDGKEIVLPRKEFELLSLMANAPKKVFSRKELSQLIWGYEIFAKNRTIDVHIRRLREKLGDKFIKTIKGIGYRLDI